MAGYKKWARAVWKEGDQEEELVIPSSWIEGKSIRWPNSSSAAAALKEMRKPEKTWLKFNLIKVKFSSDSKKECEQYDYTTTGETTEEESDIEEEILPKRKPKKRIFSDYVLEGAERSEEESCGTGSTGKHQKRMDLPPPPPLPSLATRRSNSGSRSPLRSDRNHRSRSPLRSDRVHRSRSPPSTDRSVSPPKSSRRSRSPPWSNRSHQRSMSPTYSNRSEQRSHGRYSRSPSWFDTPRQRSPTRSERHFQPSRTPAAERSSGSHLRSRSPTRSSQSSSSRPSKAGNLTVFPLTEEKFQRKTIFLLTEIRDLLQNSQRKEANSQLLSTEFNFCVIDTTEDLNSAERSLEDKDFRAKLKTMLLKVGGMDEADGVKKCMQRCLSNAMMARMNLRGHKGKASFCKTILYTVIKECVLANFPRATENSIDLVMGKYLKYAPERAGGGGRKEKNDA